MTEASKTGVFIDGKKFIAMVNGEVLGIKYGRDAYRACEILVERKLGTYQRKKPVFKKSRKSREERKVSDTKAFAPEKPVVVHTVPAQVSAAAEAVPPVDMQIVGATKKNVAYIPDQDPNFVPFGEFKNIDTIISSKMFYPVFVTGPTGNGKSTMVEQACARNGRTYIRLQINGQTDEDQLIGSKTLTSGNIEIVEGPVLLAMRAGAILLLDELDAADPNNIMCLQSILEGRPFYFKLKNEVIVPAAGFNIIATGNTKGRGTEDGKYIGTSILNEAFLERFSVTLCQDYPDQKQELSIVKAFMKQYECEDDRYANALVTWSDAIRRTYKEGAIDDVITTRRLVQIVQGYAVFKDMIHAVSLACNRFDANTKATFIDVFDKILPEVENDGQDEPVEPAAPAAPTSDEAPF